MRRIAKPARPIVRSTAAMHAQEQQLVLPPLHLSGLLVSQVVPLADQGTFARIATFRKLVLVPWESTLEPEISRSPDL